MYWGWPIYFAKPFAFLIFWTNWFGVYQIFNSKKSKYPLQVIHYEWSLVFCIWLVHILRHHCGKGVYSPTYLKDIDAKKNQTWICSVWFSRLLPVFLKILHKYLLVFLLVEAFLFYLKGVVDFPKVKLRSLKC